MRTPLTLAIAERVPVELLHGLAQGCHVVRDQVGPVSKLNKVAQLLQPVGSQGGFFQHQIIPPCLGQSAALGCHIGLVFDMGSDGSRLGAEATCLSM